MRVRNVLVVGIAWVLSLVAVGLAAQGQPAPVQVVRPHEMGEVVSGDAVGFRISPVQNEKGVVVGTLVVKVNGAWVTARLAPIIRPGGGN
jgi:hypothetical protein